MSEAVAEKTELEQAFVSASNAIRNQFERYSGVSVSQNIADYGGTGYGKLSWSVIGFCPVHFHGEGTTIEEAIDKAIAAGKLANAKRCPRCDGIVGKCGHGDN